MIDSNGQLDSPSAPRSSAALRWLEVLLIVLVFLAAGGEPTPHDNEAHYLCRLKHYWNHEWCAGDLFLESTDAQVVFIWTFGWVTRWLSLPATAWVGRAVAWSLLAWAWQRLSWRITPRPLAALLSAALFVTLNDVFHLAGEWIVGGVEAKCFAYVFVLLALREVLDGRWNRVWLLLGAAAAFHPIVGGWSVVICGGIWLTLKTSNLQHAGCKFENANWQSLMAMLPGLFGGGALAMLGVIPALRLTWGESADIVTAANRIYVFDRLPHHLALLELPTAEVYQRLSRHAVLLSALWLLSKFAISSDSAPAADVRGLRRIIRFAWGAALLAAIGFAIELALRSEPLVAAKLLRYYWFRMTDFAAPLAVSLACTALVATGLKCRRTWAMWALVVAIGATGWHLVAKSCERLANAVPPADRKMQDFAAWVDVCDWVAQHTESDAVFLTPRMNQSFKWRTGRAEVVTRKDIPQDARSIVEWFGRYRHIYYEDADGGETLEPASLGQLGTDRVWQLAQECGAKYIVTTRGKPLWLPVVYPNAQYANEEYVVYRVDTRKPASPSPGDGF